MIKANKVFICSTTSKEKLSNAISHIDIIFIKELPTPYSKPKCLLTRTEKKCYLNPLSPQSKLHNTFQNLFKEYYLLRTELEIWLASESSPFKTFFFFKIIHEVIFKFYRTQTKRSFSNTLQMSEKISSGT